MISECKKYNLWVLLKLSIKSQSTWEFLKIYEIAAMYKLCTLPVRLYAYCCSQNDALCEGNGKAKSDPFASHNATNLYIISYNSSLGGAQSICYFFFFFLNFFCRYVLPRYLKVGSPKLIFGLKLGSWEGGSLELKKGLKWWLSEKKVWKRGLEGGTYTAPVLYYLPM